MAVFSLSLMRSCRAVLGPSRAPFFPFSGCMPPTKSRTRSSAVQQTDESHERSDGENGLRGVSNLRMRLQIGFLNAEGRRIQWEDSCSNVLEVLRPAPQSCETHSARLTERIFQTLANSQFFTRSGSEKLRYYEARRLREWPNASYFGRTLPWEHIRTHWIQHLK
jgi:hypothetical protein